MKLRTVFLALGLSLSMVACGGDDASPIPIDQLPAELAAAQCAQTFRCCDAAELMDRFQGADPPITTEQECTTYLTGVFTGFLDPEPVTSGRQSYDASAAGSCISASSSAACTDQSDAPASCDRVFVGLVAAGGMCKSSSDCAGDASYCDGATSTTFGTCKARAALGASCANDPCVDDSYCDDTTVLCTALKANGAACGFDDECQSDNCDIATDLCAPPAPITTCDGV